jgi:uncharacterized membrane protein YkoI
LLHSEVLFACLLALMVGGLMCTAPVAADQDPDITASMEGVAPLRNLLAQVHAAYPGQVLEVELEWEKNGRNELWIYEVKLLTQRGSVLKLEYDAVSLELLGLEGKADN